MTNAASLSRSENGSAGCVVFANRKLSRPEESNVPHKRKAARLRERMVGGKAPRRKSFQGREFGLRGFFQDEPAFKVPIGALLRAPSFIPGVPLFRKGLEQLDLRQLPKRRRMFPPVREAGLRRRMVAG